jgi:hypothetical protein
LFAPKGSGVSPASPTPDAKTAPPTKGIPVRALSGAAIRRAAVLRGSGCPFSRPRRLRPLRVLFSDHPAT